MSADAQSAVVFEVGAHRLGIASSSVRAFVRAVAVTPLPGAPAGVDGVIDVRGEVVPLFDLRARLALEVVPVSASEQFLICTTPELGTIALRTDRILELHALEPAPTASSVGSSDPFLPSLERWPDGLIVLCDLDAILTAEAIDELARAIRELGPA